MNHLIDKKPPIVCNVYIGTAMEAKLSSTERNKLLDTDFGIPEERKFPLHDKSHVLSAIRLFNRAPINKQSELAKNIIQKIKEYQMENEVHVGENNNFYKYYIQAFE